VKRTGTLTSLETFDLEGYREGRLAKDDRMIFDLLDRDTMEHQYGCLTEVGDEGWNLQKEYVPGEQ